MEADSDKKSFTVEYKGKGKGKDVDLYSAFHVQDTSNMHSLKLSTSDLIFFNSGALPNILHYITLQVTGQPTNTALHSDPTTSHRQRQPASIGLHLRNPSLTDYYSFNRSRRDGWLSWLCWLTDIGRFAHSVVTWPLASRQSSAG